MLTNKNNQTPSSESIEVAAAAACAAAIAATAARAAERAAIIERDYQRIKADRAARVEEERRRNLAYCAYVKIACDL